MIVTCDGCSKRYKFDVARLAGRPSATLRCPNCQGSITITAQSPGDQTMRLEADANLLSKSTKIPGGDPFLPQGRRVSLAILQGADSGRTSQTPGPTTGRARGDADVVLNDDEVSRQHSCLEIHGAKVVLKDLGSTNGTFVNETKIAQCEIDNRGEFRVGGTRLMLIITDEESDLESLS
jgi:pSer/pThr/pTyr-binding forkhead associated (FHA) protein